MDWALRALGLFYVITGVVYARSFAMKDVLNADLHARKRTRTDAERLRAVLLKSMAALTIASGLALLTLSTWIAPFMLMNAVLQLGWLFWSARAFPTQDAAELLGRRRSVNALVMWMLATAFALSVIWGFSAPAVVTTSSNWLAPIGGAVFLIWLLMQ